MASAVHRHTQLRFGMLTMGQAGGVCNGPALKLAMHVLARFATEGDVRGAAGPARSREPAGGCLVLQTPL